MNDNIKTAGFWTNIKAQLKSIWKQFKKQVADDYDTYKELLECLKDNGFDLSKKVMIKKRSFYCQIIIGNDSVLFCYNQNGSKIRAIYEQLISKTLKSALQNSKYDLYCANTLSEKFMKYLNPKIIPISNGTVIIGE